MIKINQKNYFRSINQFHTFEDKIIGNGAFGTVKLALHISTCKIYALKIVNLRNFSNQNQYKVMQKQIAFHSKIDHPHIIKLWDSFIQDEILFMIMEYAEKGSLYSYQTAMHSFQQTEAFRFFSQVVQAVKYLHQNNIIHRDLKPENILIDSDYNVKICDFGWCTQKLRSKRNTFCGTFQYMAPEMLFNGQYDYRIDIWALGILLYQLLHGFAPFKGDSTEQIKQKMKLKVYHINGILSQQCKYMIQSILKFDPNDRITIQIMNNCPWSRKMEKMIGVHYGFKPIHRVKTDRNEKQYHKIIRISEEKLFPQNQKEIVEQVSKSTMKTSFYLKKSETKFNPKSQKTLLLNSNSSSRLPANQSGSFGSLRPNTQRYLKYHRDRNLTKNKWLNFRKGEHQTKKLISQTKNHKNKNKLKKKTTQEKSFLHYTNKKDSIQKKKSIEKKKSKSKSPKKQNNKIKTIKIINHNYPQYLSPQTYRQLKKSILF